MASKKTKNQECIFCGFANKTRDTHDNGYPLIPITDKKHTLSFLSNDFPEKVDGHTLIIPKKHYSSITDMPKELLHKIAEELKTHTRILKKHHGGCNILVNDGSVAEQTIDHVHFHIFPRDKGDQMRIEVWKRKKLGKQRFIQLSEQLKKELRTTK